MAAMTIAAIGEICKSQFWDRINGWEVVTAVLLIVAAWSVVQVARMYFFAEASRNCSHGDPPER